MQKFCPGIVCQHLYLLLMACIFFVVVTISGLMKFLAAAVSRYKRSNLCNGGGAFVK